MAILVTFLSCNCSLQNVLNEDSKQAMVHEQDGKLVSALKNVQGTSYMNIEQHNTQGISLVLLP